MIIPNILMDVAILCLPTFEVSKLVSISSWSSSPFTGTSPANQTLFYYFQSHRQYFVGR